MIELYLPEKYDLQLANLVRLFEQKKLSQSLLWNVPKGNQEAYLLESFLRKTLNLKNQSNFLEHTDILHIFPTATKSNFSPQLRKQELIEWRKFVEQYDFFDKQDWIDFQTLGNKQAQIGVIDANIVSEFARDKPFQLPYKIACIWYAEELNITAANKLLKLIEEPPKGLFLILITNDKDNILPTIYSRVQNIKFPELDHDEFAQYVQKQYSISLTEAESMTVKSDHNIQQLDNILNGDTTELDDFFTKWMRFLYQADLKELTTLSGAFHKEPREKQKLLLEYSLKLLGRAFLLNQKIYANSSHLETVKGFKFESFSRFIHPHNMEPIFQNIEESIYFLKRNAASKITLLNLSIRLARLLRQKV